MNWVAWIKDLKPYADLFTVCGILVVFFSWVATNVIEDRLKAARAAASEALNTFDLFITLSGIRRLVWKAVDGSLDVARRVADVVDLLSEPGEQDERHNLVRRKERNTTYFNSEVVNAEQFDEGLTLCALALRTAGQDGGTERTHSVRS